MSGGRDHAYCITLPLRTAFACVCFPGCNMFCLDEIGEQRKELGVTGGQRHVFLARQWLADCNRVEDLPYFRHLKYSNVGACPLRRVPVVGLFFRCSGYAFSYTGISWPNPQSLPACQLCIVPNRGSDHRPAQRTELLYAALILGGARARIQC